MEEIIKVAGEYYVLATSSLADDRRRVVKYANTFAVFDRFGDIQPIGLAEQGLYHDGTRFLSCLEFQIEGVRPLLLSSNVTRDNMLVTVDLTNPDIFRDNGDLIPRGAIHVRRTKFLHGGVCHEQFHISNYGLEDLQFQVDVKFQADFADIFEVRGERRKARGTLHDPEPRAQGVTLAYQGLDQLNRRTEIDFSHAPVRTDDQHAEFLWNIPARESADFFLTTACHTSEQTQPVLAYGTALENTLDNVRGVFEHECVIHTSNEQFNALMTRSVADLSMLLTRENGALYPYAGIPWYSTPFGRDGIITALETLWLNPEVARGVLDYLAGRQATEFNDGQDAEPGKILHEVRFGEMANTGELPYGRYYGSVDATPLFVVLAGHYLRRSGDHQYLHRLWPVIENCLEWIDTHGDLDEDGFIEYQRRTEYGLTNQGWKDSADSVFHENGELARGPIALVEAQAYAFMAKSEAARMAEELGMRKEAMQLHVQAREMKKRFEAVFWDESMGGYVLALDGDKHPCRVKSSNMGHTLFAGIASPERAKRVTRLLMSRAFNSGWGLRTIAEGQPRYNPMSYHNGSVWPHDNALIAQGMARYGFKEEAARILGMMFDTSQQVDQHRLPELLCGFERRTGDSPTLYPVACSPQAWAAAASIHLLQSCLGLTVNGGQQRVYLSKPVLPPFLDIVRIQDLQVGDGSLDLLFERHEHDVSVRIERRRGKVGLTLNK
jgi:glycogen debranching enzyme